MKEIVIETMNGHSVRLTSDHWTSKANQNDIGITAHFIILSWDFHSLALGIFWHEG